MNFLRLAAISLLCAASFVACGDDDDKGANGIISVPCYKATDKTCTIKGDGEASGVAADKKSCTDGGGTSVDHCPSDGLVGCCIIGSYGVGECYYDATTASSAQSACPQGGGTWQTTAP